MHSHFPFSQLVKSNSSMENPSIIDSSSETVFQIIPQSNDIALPHFALDFVPLLGPFQTLTERQWYFDKKHPLMKTYLGLSSF